MSVRPLTGRIREPGIVMTDHSLPQAPRRSPRVVALVDGSPPSLAALRAAADIAAFQGLELLGVYVQDENLLRCAAYGFAREVGASSGLLRAMDSSRLEQWMQTLAERVRRSLEQLVAERELPGSLKLCRGRVLDEVLELVRPEDLVVLGRAGWSAAPGSRFGSTARGLALRTSGNVLLWSSRSRPAGQRLVVLVGDTPGSRAQPLALAGLRARQSHRPVTILVCSRRAVSPEEADALQRPLASAGVEVRVQALPEAGAPSLRHYLRMEGAEELVISRRCSLSGLVDLERLLVTLDLPVTLTP